MCPVISYTSPYLLWTSPLTIAKAIVKNPVQALTLFAWQYPTSKHVQGIFLFLPQGFSNSLAWDPSGNPFSLTTWGNLGDLKLIGDVSQLLNASPCLLRLTSFENHFMRFFRKSHIKPVIGLASSETTFFSPLFSLQSLMSAPCQQTSQINYWHTEESCGLCVKYKGDLI